MKPTVGVAYTNQPLVILMILFVEINECQPDPCENNGRCEDALGTYWCKCPQGFVGQTCQGGE